MLAVSAGSPLTPSQDFCSLNSPIQVNNAILLNSPSYPKYPTQDTACKKDIIAPPGKALKVYTVDTAFKGSGLT